jgi:hypothetical protein
VIEDGDFVNVKPRVLGVYPNKVIPFLRTLICAEALNAVNTITAARKIFFMFVLFYVNTWGVIRNSTPLFIFFRKDAN